MTFGGQRHCWTLSTWHPHDYERRMASSSAFSRRLCVAAVTAAFVIGIVVGILLPLYVPPSSPLPLALLPNSAPLARGNASEINAIIADGPWEGDGRNEVVQSAQSDPQKPRAGTPHGALSWTTVDTSPSTSQDGVVSRTQKVRSQSGSSRNKVQGGPETPYQSIVKDPVISPKDKPSLNDLWRRTSSQQPRRTNAVSDNVTQITRPKQWLHPVQVSEQYESPSSRRVPNRKVYRTEAHVLPVTVSGPEDVSQDVPLEDLVDGVYWSDRVERSLPQGFSPREVADWTSFAANTTVVKVAEGCGRMQNRLLVFDNGTKSCCRYRQNNDQIQGEIFSFYLAQLLGLRSLPPATLGLVHGHEGQWRTVRGQLTLAQWNEQKPVVMTRFVDDLVPAHIPRHFRGGSGPKEQRRLHPVPEDLVGLAPEALREVAQWSDLVVFDYLTANLDRVVNNMYNKQWNPDMMSAPAHNLAKVAKTGLLVFLDNESGLLHGYRLLDKYESYHKAMLEGLCVFRRATAKAVLKLHQAGDVGQRLKMALMESQPQMAEWLPLLPDKSVKILRERLARVAQQILQCEHMYANPSSTLDSNLVGSREDLHDSLTRPNMESS